MTAGSAEDPQIRDLLVGIFNPTKMAIYRHIIIYIYIYVYMMINIIYIHVNVCTKIMYVCIYIYIYILIYELCPIFGCTQFSSIAMSSPICVFVLFYGVSRPQGLLFSRRTLNAALTTLGRGRQWQICLDLLRRPAADRIRASSRFHPQMMPNLMGK